MLTRLPNARWPFCGAPCGNMALHNEPHDAADKNCNWVGVVCCSDEG